MLDKFQVVYLSDGSQKFSFEVYAEDIGAAHHVASSFLPFFTKAYNSNNLYTVSVNPSNIINILRVPIAEYEEAKPIGSSVLCTETKHVWTYTTRSADECIPDGIPCSCGKVISAYKKCEKCGSIIMSPAPNEEIMK